MSEYDETWKAIKKAVVIALSEDCMCSGRRWACVPCRRWRQVQQAIPGLEMMEQERDEARKVAEECRHEASAWAPPALVPWEVLPWENEE